MKRHLGWRHCTGKLFSWLLTLAMLVASIQLPMTVSAKDSAAEAKEKVACYVFYGTEFEKLTDVELYYEIFNPTAANGYQPSIQTAQKVDGSKGEYLITVDMERLKAGEMLWVYFKMPRDLYAGPVNWGAVREISFTSDYEEIERNWNGCTVEGKTYDFFCSYECTDTEFLFRDDFNGDIGFMYCGKESLAKHAIVVVKLGNSDNAIWPSDLNDQGYLSFNTPKYVDGNYVHYVTYTDSITDASPYLTNRQEGKYSFSYKACIEQEFGNEEGNYLVAFYPMDVNGRILENSGMSFYFGENGGDDIFFDCQLKADGGTFSIESISENGVPSKWEAEEIGFGRMQKQSIGDALESINWNILEVSKEGYLHTGWDIFHYSFDNLEYCSEEKKNAPDYLLLYAPENEDGTKTYVYIRKDNLEYNDYLSHCVKNLEDLMSLGDSFNYYVVATWDTRNEIVVSDTETLIQDVNGSEIRKVSTEKNGNVTVAGDAKVIPEGAVFTQTQETEGSDNYKAVQKALENTSNETLKPVNHFRVMEFTLTNKAGEGLHKLDGIVEVKLPVPDDFVIAENHMLQVYGLEEDGSLKACETIVSEEGITFRTNHFSLYLLAEINEDIYENPFVDVENDKWYYPYVQFANQKGLMIGQVVNGVRIFAPNANLTRAEFVQTIYSLENKPQGAYEAYFTDVPQDKWFTNAVVWARKNNIVAGKGDIFDVNGEITREEMATMLKAYAKYKKYDVTGDVDLSKYADESSISSWAVNNMKWAVSHGIMVGKGKVLDPRGKATRAECATMLKKFCEIFEN